MISAVSAVAPLAAAGVTMGLITWAGSGWLASWVPAYAVERIEPQDPRRRYRTVAQRVSGEMLVWVDCEMTGLDLTSDALIEVAALVTDADLNVLGDGVDLVIKPTAAALEQMGDFVRDHAPGLRPAGPSWTTG